MFLLVPRLVAQAPQIRGLVSCLRDGPHNVDYVPRLSMALPALFLLFFWLFYALGRPSKSRAGIN